MSLGAVSTLVAFRTLADAVNRGAFRLFDFALDVGRRLVFVFFGVVAMGLSSEQAKDRPPANG
jgi:hypothetical protein